MWASSRTETCSSASETQPRPVQQGAQRKHGLFANRSGLFFAEDLKFYLRWKRYEGYLGYSWDGGRGVHMELTVFLWISRCSTLELLAFASLQFKSMVKPVLGGSYTVLCAALIEELLLCIASFDHDFTDCYTVRVQVPNTQGLYPRPSFQFLIHKPHMPHA